jgi:hypothetical protein
LFRRYSIYTRSIQPANIAGAPSSRPIYFLRPPSLHELSGRL